MLVDSPPALGDHPKVARGGIDGVGEVQLPARHQVGGRVQEAGRRGVMPVVEQLEVEDDEVEHLAPAVEPLRRRARRLPGERRVQEGPGPLARGPQVERGVADDVVRIEPVLVPEAMAEKGEFGCAEQQAAPARKLVPVQLVDLEGAEIGPLWRVAGIGHRHPQRIGAAHPGIGAAALLIPGLRRRQRHVAGAVIMVARRDGPLRRALEDGPVAPLLEGVDRIGDIAGQIVEGDGAPRRAVVRPRAVGQVHVPDDGLGDGLAIVAHAARSGDRRAALDVERRIFEPQRRIGRHRIGRIEQRAIGIAGAPGPVDHRPIVALLPRHDADIAEAVRLPLIARAAAEDAQVVAVDRIVEVAAERHAQVEQRHRSADAGLVVVAGIAVAPDDARADRAVRIPAMLAAGDRAAAPVERPLEMGRDVGAVERAAVGPLDGREQPVLAVVDQPFVRDHIGVAAARIAERIVGHDARVPVIAELELDIVARADRLAAIGDAVDHGNGPPRQAFDPGRLRGAQPGVLETAVLHRRPGHNQFVRVRHARPARPVDQHRLPGLARRHVERADGDVERADRSVRPAPRQRPRRLRRRHGARVDDEARQVGARDHAVRDRRIALLHHRPVEADRDLTDEQPVDRLPQIAERGVDREAHLGRDPGLERRPERSARRLAVDQEGERPARPRRIVAPFDLQQLLDAGGAVDRAGEPGLGPIATPDHAFEPVAAIAGHQCDRADRPARQVEEQRPVRARRHDPPERTAQPPGRLGPQRIGAGAEIDAERLRLEVAAPVEQHALPGRLAGPGDGEADPAGQPVALARRGGGLRRKAPDGAGRPILDGFDPPRDRQPRRYRETILALARRQVERNDAAGIAVDHGLGIADCPLGVPPNSRHPSEGWGPCLSSARWHLRRKQTWMPAFAGMTKKVCWLDGEGQPNVFLSSSLTTPGLALPPIAFIVWPTKKPNSLSLPPRYSATLSALAAITSAITASIAPVSLVCLRPRSSTILAGSSPVSSMISNTCLASVPDNVPSATSASSSAPCLGLTGLSSIALPSRLSAPNRSEISQLDAARATSAPGLPAASSSASNQRAVSTSEVSTAALYAGSPSSPS
ncbi:hypothetical protein Swit_0596 [Rhizorhabdus wittichii RW1]|uniref:Uncharacterized protein n=1 Tax=Rhizorhabdus wittichii (strain DSM 6014 / CCUG 31198 / JCM 15750 / NBRC 105917 / EY 4224 / RW1) TaxID=392499 RepID=A0A9J9LCE8_RHIWR|nr:hypothetical protein Swit_0596 [Rhizorhabdus wittichii RW1]